ncbi:MAG: hypothetical protein IPN71_00610 [Fibrobacteres bacterium]|nr:hypothetical protein [Fibrobacterota bacterium]
MIHSLLPAIGLLAAAPSPLAGIELSGLQRTRPQTVLREFPASATTDSLAFELGLQRLRNTALFSKVQGTWTPDAQVVALSEKWTTIPILKLRSGGGVTAYTLGLYDPNLLGRYLEAGAQYENHEGTHSGVVWLREPRLLGTRTLLGADAWITHRLREDFAGESSRGWHGERRVRLHVFAEPEVRAGIVPHAGLEWLDDTLSSDLLELPREIAATRRFGLSSRSLVANLGLRLGRIDTDLEMQEGWTIEPRADIALAGSSFHRESIEARGFLRPAARLNFATRLFWGTGSRRAEFHDWRIGGLEQVRGLPDNFLLDDQAWFANFESRATVWRGDFVRLQAVVFADAGGIPGMDRRTSFGAGVRLLSPKLYRLVVRMDWAHGFEGGFSGGLQQFF